MTVMIKLINLLPSIKHKIKINIKIILHCHKKIKINFYRYNLKNKPHVRPPCAITYRKGAPPISKHLSKTKNFPSQSNIVQTYGKRSLPLLGAYGFIFFSYL